MKIKNLITAFSSSCLILIMANTALAQGQLGKQCEFNPIDENGSSVYFNSDCTAGFVAPPPAGEVKIIGYSDRDLDTYCPKRTLDLTKWEGLIASIESSLINAFGAGDAELIAQYEANLLKAKELKQEAMAVYAPYEQIIGMTASLGFTSNWDQHIAKYAAANPQIPNFARVHLDTSQMWIGGIQNGQAAPDQSVLSWIAGADHSGFNFNGGMAGTVTLPYTHACDLYAAAENNKTDIKSSLLTYLVPNVNFKYSVKTPLGYKAAFKAKNFFQRIEKKSEINIFFWSKKKHSIKDGHYADDDFEIQFLDNSNNTFTLEQKTAIMKEVKASMIGEVAKHVLAYAKFTGDTSLTKDVTLPEVDKAGMNTFGQAMSDAICDTAGFGSAGKEDSLGQTTGSVASSTTAAVMTGGLSVFACPASKIAAALLNLVGVTSSEARFEATRDYVVRDSIRFGGFKQFTTSMYFKPKE